MNSLIFRSAAATMLPVMLVLSVIILLRGHNDPGGGFVGGLLAASGFGLVALANGADAARRLLRIDVLALIGLGMVVTAASGLPGLLMGGPFLEGLWTSVTLPGFEKPLKLGTPLVFDIGVYMVVLGGTVLMILTLEELRDESLARS